MLGLSLPEEFKTRIHERRKRVGTGSGERRDDYVGEKEVNVSGLTRSRKTSSQRRRSSGGSDRTRVPLQKEPVSFSR